MGQMQVHKKSQYQDAALTSIDARKAEANTQDGAGLDSSPGQDAHSAATEYHAAKVR